MYTIFKKELKSYFDHPIAYILMVVFLVVNSFFFFRIVYLQGVADMRPMFDTLPWLLMFFVPAITMRQFAEERKSGTFELLLSQPIHLWRVLTGKLCASVAFLGIAIACTLIIPIMLAGSGAFDWGQIIAQYIGAIILLFALSSIGLLTSAATKNQVVSFISSLAISFFFIIAGLEIVTLGLSGLFRTIVGQLSAFAHYQNIIRGVLDIRDVVYFATFIGSFLSVTYLLLARITSNTATAGFRKLKAGVAALVIISVLVNLVGSYIPGRVDFTKNRLYTLSPATKDLLHSLDDIVTIKLFAVDNLPPQIALVERDVRDTLRDFERASNGNISVEYVTVTDDQDSVQSAQQYGIAPVQFNTLQEQELSVKQGYFGLAVAYLDDFKSIPFIQDTSDLEYQLDSYIRSLTVSEKSTIGFLTGHGEKSIYSDIPTLRQELEKQYAVEEVSLLETSDDSEASAQIVSVNPIPDSITTLVIAGPTQVVNEDEREAIRAFMHRGGTVLFLVDPVVINAQYMQAVPNPNSLSDFIAEFGVTVDDNLVYDVRSNQSVTFGGGYINYVLPYPFWPVAVNTSDHVSARDIANISLMWPSSVHGTAQDDDRVTNLFSTTEFGGVQTSNYTIAPDQQLMINPESLTTYPLAVAATFTEEGSDSATGRMIVVGDSDFILDQFTRSQSSISNLVFALNAIDWLAQDETLISIRAKNRQPDLLQFTDEHKNYPNVVRLINLIGIPFLVAVYGLIRLLRRRKKTRMRA